MYTILKDLRFALRQLRKHLGFTVMATATLALGIGAATAVFSLVDAVLLQPLPFPQPERIVALGTLEKATAGSSTATVPNETSYPNFFDWRSRARSFESIASHETDSFTLAMGNAPAQRIDGMVVSSDFFHVLGVGPALGRTFLRSEEQAGNRSVIISHSLWQTAFNASPSAIGQTLHLSDESYTVVGVMPASFQFPNAPDAQVWITPSLTQEGKNSSGQQRGWNQLDVIGRLAPGVSIEQARAEMQTIQRTLASQYPDEDKLETAVSVKPQLQDLVGDIQRPLNILFASVCALLLIACANVAGLLLTRTAARRPELALRSALGATRLQIVRQLLIESLAVSSLGGLAGFALAAFALRLAPQFLPSDLPRIQELSLNPRVFFFSLAASLVTGLLFGVLPAWRSSRLDPALALNDSTRTSTAGRGQNRLQGALVIGETALGLILLIGAGLLIRSFDKLMNVDPGFNHTHVIAFRVGMTAKRFQDDRLLQLSQQLQSRFAAVPGVQQSTFGFPMPLAGGAMSITFTIDGRPNPTGEDPTARSSVVAANFFTALQMPLRHGRFFNASEDRAGSPPVVIVNQAFADRFFPGEAAVGKRITSCLSSESREIVGVVGNVVRSRLSEAPAPEYFIPFAQVPIGPPVFALRVAGDPGSYVDTVRGVVAQQDASLPVYSVRTNLLTRSTAQQRFQTILISAFAAIALLLLAIGLVASAALTRYLTTLLFHTPALDALTFAATTTLLLIVSTASCLVPAWRASRLNPNETLRQQ